METKIEEILGFNTTKGKDSETVTRRFYVTAETPETAKEAFQELADSLTVPDDLELGHVDLDEEKNVNDLYFGTITFTSPNPKIKTKIDNDLFEVYGEKMSEGRKTASHERFFRIKAANANTAKDKLETSIRNTSLTSGRLHISDISVDEDQDGDGFFSGSVTYNNPDHKGNSDRITGHIPAYGTRWSEQYENGIHTASAAENVFELRGYSDAYSALQ
jgi:hypothetical protein